MKSLPVLVLCFVSLVSSAMGQVCNDDFCNPPEGFPVGVEILSNIETQLATEVANAQSRGPSDKNAVQVTTGGGCGSGSVVGRDERGTYILTNAHVAGTRVGRVVNLRGVVDGREVGHRGTVIMAAYSDRTLTDWAVVLTDGFAEIEPVPLSKEKPVGTHYTRGSPRCVWPLTSTAVITADIADNSPLWRWRPNAIGGQSGSGVWSSETDVQDGLLTWSWGGLGAGQQTSEIYRQATQRTTTGAPRIAGLQELVTPDPAAANPLIVETGFYAQTNITTLPIWESDEVDPEPDPDEPVEGDVSVEWTKEGDTITIEIKTK